MQVSVAEGYRLWAPAYDSTPNPLIALESRVMKAVLPKIAPRQVVDIACGTGRWSLYFAKKSPRVFGIDACPQMSQVAKRHKLLRDRIIVGDALQLPVRSSTADLVVCGLSVGHFPDVRRAFAEMARIAAPGCVVAVSDLHPDAVAAGWTGSFRIGGAQYGIQNFRHSITEVRSAAAAADLRITFEADAHFGSPERKILESAGKGEYFEDLRKVTALWIGLWKKP